MQRPYINNVCLADKFMGHSGWRMGTVFMTLEQFSRKFGSPHAENFGADGIDGAGKVHAVWHINTPRGPVEVGDYWWNPADQLSVRTGNWYAFLWAKGWLNMHGARCVSGNGK